MTIYSVVGPNRDAARARLVIEPPAIGRDFELVSVDIEPSFSRLPSVKNLLRYIKQKETKVTKFFVYPGRTSRSSHPAVYPKRGSNHQFLSGRTKSHGSALVPGEAAINLLTCERKSSLPDRRRESQRRWTIAKSPVS